jgi:DNA (cytosine-5)-methyltransferase 1
MKVLDLFSGIGGFSLGLHRAGMQTVAFCEIEKYPQAVLKKNFPGVPIYDDVRTITAEQLRADGIDTVDLVCGGFPCQPFSVAGKQQGKDDHRHLWPEMFRIIQETKPSWVIGENVAGFVSMALSEVCSDLESTGYEVQPVVIPACAVNALHRRDRVWILAYSDAAKQRGQQRKSQIENHVVPYPGLQRPEISKKQAAGLEQCSQANGYTNGAGCEKQHVADLAARQGQRTGELVATGPDWTTESPFCGVANGISRRVDRLKCLGNAVVPQIPEIIGRAIMQTELAARPMAQKDL